MTAKQTDRAPLKMILNKYSMFLWLKSLLKCHESQLHAQQIRCKVWSAKSPYSLKEKLL